MEEPKPRRSRIIIRKTKKQSENSIKNFTPSKDVNVNQSKYLYTNFIDVPNLNDNMKYTLISSSQYTNIYLVQNVINKKLYVKKTIDISEIPNYKEIIKRMIKLYRTINNDNILTLYCVHKDKSNKINLIVQYAQKGSLSNVLEKNGGGLTEEKSFLYFYQIVKALKYLHSKKIIVRNINPTNLLIGKHDKVFIYDFTQYKKKSKFYDYSEDIWSLGVILYVLTQGISNENTNYSFKTKISFDCENLIRKLLDGKEIKTIEQVLDDKWMRKYMSNMNNLVLNQFKEFTQEKAKQVKSLERKTCKSQDNEEDSFDYIKADKSIDTTMSDINSIINYNTRQSSNYQSNTNRHFNTLLNEEDIFEKDTHFMEENRIRIVNPKDTNNFWDNFAKYFVGGCKE